MKTLLISTLLLLATASAGLTEPPTTEEATIELIGQKLAELSETNEMMASALGTSNVADLTKKAITTVKELKETLSANPFIRVSGFTVGIPGGVSVDFEFVDEK
jgi:hypothetical protein